MMSAIWTDQKAPEKKSMRNGRNHIEKVETKHSFKYQLEFSYRRDQPAIVVIKIIRERFGQFTQKQT